MIVVPSFSTPNQYRLYQDAKDESLAYVDTLNPQPVQRKAIRWIQLSDHQASVTGEIRFGPGEKDFEQVAKRSCSERLMPMPWTSGPVYVWTEWSDEVQLLTLGETSGYGIHNTVFSGTTASGAVRKPVAIAAELYCSGQLSQAHIQAGGKSEVVEEALGHLPLGKRAPKMATLADVLLPVLQQLVNRKGLIILAKAEALSIGALEELRQLVLAEWAHRILAACAGKSLSLAMPAASISALNLVQPLNLEINWSAGEVVPIRVIRALRAKGRRTAQGQKAQGQKEKVTTVDVVIEGDWQSFDYVEVSLNNSRDQADVTLTEAKATKRCELRSGKSVQATAVAGVRRFGVKVPLETVQVTSDRVVVSLVPLKEKAFLVKAARSLLKKTGAIDISISHPAVAKVLVPRKKTLTLCDSQGDLAQVSAVYRALIWQNEQQSAPFEVTVQPVRGPCVQWNEADVDDVIIISPKRLSPST